MTDHTTWQTQPDVGAVLHNHEERLAALELALPAVFSRLDALELALPSAIARQNVAATLEGLETIARDDYAQALADLTGRLEQLEAAVSDADARMASDPQGPLMRLERAAADLRASIAGAPHQPTECPYAMCLFRGDEAELAAHLVTKHGRTDLVKFFDLAARESGGGGDYPLERDRTAEGPADLAAPLGRLACGCLAEGTNHHNLCVVAPGQPVTATTLLEQGVDPAAVVVECPHGCGYASSERDVTDHRAIVHGETPHG